MFRQPHVVTSLLAAAAVVLLLADAQKASHPDCDSASLTDSASLPVAPAGRSSSLSASLRTKRTVPVGHEPLAWKPNLGIPGWLVERLFHDAPLQCPWQNEGEEPDEACVRRSAEITAMRNAIGRCSSPYQRTDRVYGHRGSPLIAPEETEVSWRIAAESGAGFLECDVSVTKELDFVCRHGTCDLQTTTDIIRNHPELSSKCTKPWFPGSGSDAVCCTYDFTVEELGTLCAIMDSVTNASASSPEGYLLGVPGFRTNALTEGQCHKIVRYTEYLTLLKQYGYNAIPELKDTATTGVNELLASKNKDFRFLADKFAQELTARGFTGGLHANGGQLKSVMQTFDYRVAEHWRQSWPDLVVEYMWESPPPEGSNCTKMGSDCGGTELVKHLAKMGVQVFGPPVNLLLAPMEDHGIKASETAVMLQGLGDGVAISTWSLERYGCKSRGSPTTELQPSMIPPCGTPDDWGYSGLEGKSVFQNADVLRIMEALFRKVRIIGLFSDFPALTSAYVNCVLSVESL